MKESAEKCPFCGEIPFLVTESELRCHCYAVFKNMAPLGELLYLWNRRPIEDALRAENEALKAELLELREKLSSVPPDDDRCDLCCCLPCQCDWGDEDDLD